jgi:AraC-like DNA-binding protein
MSGLFIPEIITYIQARFLRLFLRLKILNAISCRGAGMSILRFVIFKQDNYVRFHYENLKVEANKLIVFRDVFEVLMPGEHVAINCTMQQLLEVCDSLCENLSESYFSYERRSFRILDFTDSAQKTLDFLLGTDKCLAVPYIISYCLSRDWKYYSEMFLSLINDGGELIGFMKEHAFNPWPVERYATMLGISLRKFNYIFKARFGVSPKHWLIESRLIRARYLLTYTSKPVADVANHCGFNNHAYFSESFRKRFSCSPSQWRDKHVLSINQIKKPEVDYES